MFKQWKEDIAAIRTRDPAARNNFEVFFLYAGFKALRRHRRAHWWYNRKHYFIARWISERTRRKTGIEIHPAAKIGKGLFIDHGSGVVIGETVEIGDNVTIYQGVTLGGTGKDKGKRHPSIGNNVLIGAGAAILGPFTVHDNARIASGAVVLKEVPENATAVGVPARIVRIGDQKISPLDHVNTPDPVNQCISQLQKDVDELKAKLGIQRDTNGAL
ncbi:MAG: serine O-acetyltransferase [Oscillospiraceae bacterium]|nr:serine O-acetyltransferase [Oscillospiraceae bacterium]